MCAAPTNAADMDAVIAARDLTLTNNKTQTLIMTPAGNSAGIFRRSDALSWPSPKQKLQREYRQDARGSQVCLDSRPNAQAGEDGVSAWALPYPANYAAKVQGKSSGQAVHTG